MFPKAILSKKEKIVVGFLRYGVFYLLEVLKSQFDGNCIANTPYHSNSF